MKKVFTKEWFKAAGIRALRTAAQTALGMFTVGAALHEVNSRADKNNGVNFFMLSSHIRADKSARLWSA